MKRITTCIICLVFSLLLSSVTANAENVFAGHMQNAGSIWVLTLKKCKLPITDAQYMHAFEMKKTVSPTDGCWGETLEGTIKIIAVTHFPSGNFVNTIIDSKLLYLPGKLDRTKGVINFGKPTKEWGWLVYTGIMNIGQINYLPLCEHEYVSEHPANENGEGCIPSMTEK